MLRYDKLTVKAQEALQAAQNIAEKGGQQQLEPLHLLAALVAQRDGIVPPLLNRLGVRPESLTSEIEKLQARLPKVTGVSQQFLGEAANQVLEKAFISARRRAASIVPYNVTLGGSASPGSTMQPGQMVVDAPKRTPSPTSAPRWLRPESILWPP